MDSALPDAPPSDAGPPDGAVPDVAVQPDSGADEGVSPSDGGFCTPNRDGRIERSEVPIRAGLRANFQSATDVSFDTRGAMVDGVRTWDLSGAFEGDENLSVDTRPVDGEWFAEDFVGATYAAELSAESDLIGVFEANERALLLRGVVSPEDGFTRTNLENDPAVVVLDFPLERDKQWTSDVDVSGFALGVISVYSERYESEVDGAGTLITPFGRFDDVLRVRTELTRTVGLLTTRIVTFAFVSECFGTVATLTGRDNDDGQELGELAEVRRLAP